MERLANLRQIQYERYEYLHESNSVHAGNLLTFVYDIPHFSACGVFPPHHIANQIFSRGEAGGGMSPGTKWEPFTIPEVEYAVLAEAVKQTAVSEIKPHARYAFFPNFRLADMVRGGMQRTSGSLLCRTPERRVRVVS